MLKLCRKLDLKLQKDIEFDKFIKKTRKIWLCYLSIMDLFS